MSFLLKWDALCGVCHGEMIAGDDAVYARVEGEDIIVHAPRCPHERIKLPHINEDLAAMKHPICPRCWTRHPGAC